MKSFLISLTIHALVIFAWGLNRQSVVNPTIAPSEEVFHVSIQLDEEEVKELQKSFKTIQKRAQKRPIKKVVKKLVQKSSTQSLVKKEKITKVEGEKVLNAYFAELRKFIENKKHYPKRAIRLRQAGAVEICLEIDQNGHFHDIKIKNPSEFTTLNEAALSLVKEISKFKPLPKEMGEKVTLNIPLKYALNN